MSYMACRFKPNSTCIFQKIYVSFAIYSYCAQNHESHLAHLKLYTVILPYMAIVLYSCTPYMTTIINFMHILYLPYIVFSPYRKINNQID